MSVEKEIAILFAGAYGYLDDYAVDSVKEYETQMLEFMESKHDDILSEIKEKGDISDELEGKMKKALDDFKGVFQPSAV
jgi:F-type H+-transporting ATPase subunit alpha